MLIFYKRGMAVGPERPLPTPPPLPGTWSALARGLYATNIQPHNTDFTSRRHSPRFED